MIIHKANTEKNKLAGRKSLSLNYVGESYGIFATHLAEDNANSSLLVKNLYDSSHEVPRFAAALP
jgi:hypothetical protein